jgi:NAD-dependent DNA ligase
MLIQLCVGNRKCVGNLIENLLVLHVSSERNADTGIELYQKPKIPKSNKKSIEFCLTGRFSRSHSKISKQYELLGCSLTEKISRNTNYVIVGRNPKMSIICDAEAYQVEMLSLDEFNQVLMIPKP